MTRREAGRRENQQRLALSPRETAEALKIGINQAYAGIKSGEIPSIKIGGRILVPVAALERRLLGEG